MPPDAVPKDFPAYKRVRVADLIPYARNARTHSDDQVAQIAASIREFGVFIRPRPRVLSAGEGRLVTASGRR